MTYSNRGGFGGNRGQNFSRGSFNNRGGSDRPALHDAICAKCGTNCQVPFRPNGSRDVFCSKCFETNGGESRGGFGGNRDSRDSRAPRRFEKRDTTDVYFSDRQMFDVVCDECGKNCQVPFQPKSDKPVLCSQCFENSRGGDSRSSSKPSRDGGVDLGAINAKLDKIIGLLTPFESKKSEKKEAKKEDVSKEITEKILEEIEEGTGKKPVTSKKKAKKAVSKVSKKKTK